MMYYKICLFRSFETIEYLSHFSKVSVTNAIEPIKASDVNILYLKPYYESRIILYLCR